MAEAPGPAREPAAVAILDGERSDGSKMVRSGEYVKQAGQQASQRNKRHAGRLYRTCRAKARLRGWICLAESATAQRRTAGVARYGPGKTLGAVPAPAAAVAEAERRCGKRLDRSKMIDWSPS